MSERYQVVEGSESCHFCFKATVVDTKKPDENNRVCECSDLARARDVADAMNKAEPGPVFQDQCGKEFDVRSALLYFPNGRSEPMLVLPCQSEFDTGTGRWRLDVTTFVDSHQHLIYGRMFKKHLQLLKLEANGEDIQRVF